jgi:hypothetical protein
MFKKESEEHIKLKEKMSQRKQNRQTFKQTPKCIKKKAIFVHP